MAAIAWRTSMSASGDQPGDGPDQAMLRARFEAETMVAGIAVTDDDREPLFAMWADHQPVRDRLRGADLALEEEPSFTQKPAQLGAGLAPTSSTGGGPA